MIFLRVIGIFFLGLFFLPHTSTVFAQTGGTCTCVVGESRICGLTANNCITGYQPSIANYACTCVSSTPQNCISVGLGCGSPSDQGKLCCSPATCYMQNCVIGAPTPEIPGKQPSVCESLPEPSKGTCNLCQNQKGDAHVWTAIGCIEASPTGLVNSFLPFGIGIAGGIAFLLILFGALQIMMSAGNPEKLNAGKELVTAAITGLLLIIFSVFLLQLIGFKILRIPGFG